MKKISRYAVVALACLTASCHDKSSTLEVGVIAGPEAQLALEAADVAKKKYGLSVSLVPFTDYNVPNMALADGSIDVNVFQHKPFLEAQEKARGYKFVILGRTFIYPMALYSKKIKTLAALKEGSKIAIPNDPSNEARALLLLQDASLITLKPGVGFTATPLAIVANPKHLKIIPLSAAQLPRALGDVALAAINTNYARAAELSPARDGLFLEKKSSAYANIMVARASDKNDPRLMEYVKAMQSEAVLKKAHELFGDDVMKAW